MCRYIESKEARVDAVGLVPQQKQVAGELSCPHASLLTNEATHAVPSLNHPTHTMQQVHPFLLDAHRAVRLAKRYGHKAEARHLLIQLNALTQAMLMAGSVEQGIQIVNEVWFYIPLQWNRFLQI
jgi:hypothetical protein